jgi:hypothetical protein
MLLVLASTVHCSALMGDMSHLVSRPKQDDHRMYAQDQVVIHMTII